MRIEFERSGGFAGISLTVTIETDSLSQQEADEVCRLVEDAGFFELAAEITDSAPVADQFNYKVTVEAEGRQHTVQTTDSAAPPALQPLLEWLNLAARRARRRGGP